MRTNEEITETYRQYADMLYRICYAYLKNSADTEDAVQDIFVKLILHEKKGKEFESKENEKAWLILTAGNLCKDRLRNRWRTSANIDDYSNSLCFSAPEFEPDETLAAVFALPKKYKTAVYMYYYEGYSGEEIAKILKKPHSTIRNHLSEARKLLKKKLGGRSGNLGALEVVK